jgi:hypothetical protein
MSAVCLPTYYATQNVLSGDGIFDIDVLDAQNQPIRVTAYDTVFVRPGRWVIAKCGSIINDTAGFITGPVQTYPRRVGGSLFLRVAKVEKQAIKFPDGVTYQCIVMTLENK